MATYGNCVSCGFPILVDGPDLVTCPRCFTEHEPNPISFAPLAAIGLPLVLGIGAFIIGLIGKKGAKKAAIYTAGYVAEPAIEAGAEWAKRKVKRKLEKKE